MTKLEKILNDHNINGRDKEGGTDKCTIHSYAGEYESYLKPFLSKNPSLLEIGVWEGGSALLWQEYISPKVIVGIDIDDYIKVRHKLNSSFKFYHMNAYTDATVGRIKNDFPEGFDIIIEDGIHTDESNRFSIENYLPMLRSGGVMIIEDVPVNTSVEIPFGYSKREPSVVEAMISCIPEGYRATTLDLTELKGRFDDFLMVIEKL